MSEQEARKGIVDDEKKAINVANKKMGIIHKLKLGLKNLFKKAILQLKLKCKAFLDRVKKIFIRQEEERTRKRLAKKEPELQKREIPSVLRDVADLDTKVDLFLQTHQEPTANNSSVNYAIVEKIKAEEHKKSIDGGLPSDGSNSYLSKHLERKNHIERLSAHSIDLISSKILENSKVKSFIERELSRSATEPSVAI